MGLLKDTVKTVSTMFVILFFFSHTVFVNFSETNAYKIHGFNTSTLLSHRHFFNHDATLRIRKKKYSKEMKTHVSNCWISELPKSERKKKS